MAEKRVNLEDLRNMLPPMLTCKDVFIYWGSLLLAN